MMKLKVYLINLKRSEDRLVFMNKQLDKLGLAYERFEAYDGKLMSIEFIKSNSNYDEVVKKEISPGLIGCTFSHLFLYKLISERNDQHILILEDDMLLSKDFFDVVNLAVKELNDGEIIFPYFIPKPNCRLTTENEIKLNDKYSIKTFVDYHRALATGAYLLTKQTATDLYNGLYPMSTFVDDWPNMYEKGMVKKFKTIYPLIARSADFRSEIGYLKDKPVIKSIVNFIQDKTPLLNWFFKLYRKRVADKLRNQIILTDEKIAH